MWISLFAISLAMAASFGVSAIMMQPKDDQKKQHQTCFG
jgi:hypothetical protein